MTKCGIICEQISGLNDRLMRQTHPSERYLGNLSRLYYIRFTVLEPCLNDKHVTSDVFEIRQHTNEQMGNTCNWFQLLQRNMCGVLFGWIQKQTQRSILYVLCIVDVYVLLMRFLCLNHSMYFVKEIIYFIIWTTLYKRNKQETLGIYQVNFWNMPKYSEIKENRKGVSFPICKLKHA